MLGLWLNLFLVWLILLAIFWGGGLWLQAFLYSAPDEQMHWRAPLAASILVAFYSGWCLLAVQHPGRHDTILRINPSDEKQFKQIWVEQDKARIEYKERLVSQGDRMPSRSEHVEARPPYRPWQRSDSILVNEDGRDVRFTAPRDQDGKFQLGPGGALIYRDPAGRAMSEESLGIVSVFRWDVFLFNALMNLLHLGLWFACCWLVLRFQWGHALLLAFSGWGLMLIIVLPMLFDKAVAASSRPQPAGLAVFYGEHAPEAAAIDSWIGPRADL